MIDARIKDTFHMQNRLKDFATGILFISMVSDSTLQWCVQTVIWSVLVTDQTIHTHLKRLILPLSNLHVCEVIFSSFTLNKTDATLNTKSDKNLGVILGQVKVKVMFEIYYISYIICYITFHIYFKIYFLNSISKI
jgi:hypothetical protein